MGNNFIGNSNKKESCFRKKNGGSKEKEKQKTSMTE